MYRRFSILVVLSMAGACLHRPSPSQAILFGSVLSQGSGEPVRAYVVLEDTQWGTSTHTLGTYRLGPIPSGVYRVAFRPMCLDTAVLRREVTLEGQSPVNLAVRVALEASYQCRIVEFEQH